MPTDARPPISDAEREVLQVLWEHGPGGVRDVHQRLALRGPRWSRSTVITLLQRLEKKGYVASDRSSYAFVFRAVVTREELLHQRMLELADEWCGGQAAPLLLAFAQHQPFSEAELAEFRKLIEQLAREPKRGKKK